MPPWKKSGTRWLLPSVTAPRDGHRLSCAHGFGSVKASLSSSRKWKRSAKASSQSNRQPPSIARRSRKRLPQYPTSLRRDGIELAELLERSEELIKRHDLLVQNRAQLSSTLAASRAEQAGARLSLQSAQRELDAWRLDWSDKMNRIGLEPGASPAQAEVDPDCDRQSVSRARQPSRVPETDSGH